MKSAYGGIRLEEAKEALLAILRLTEAESAITPQKLSQNSTLTEREASSLLGWLVSRGLAEKAVEGVCFTPLQRIGLAVEAVKLGASPERACRNLSWKEFEQLVEHVLKVNGYEVALHLRVKIGDKRSEVDVFAIKGRLAIVGDCKHWRKPLFPSGAKKAAKLQISRLKALREAENLKVLKSKMGGFLPRKFQATPIIITLFEFPSKMVEGVPIVPVTKLANFLSELPSYLPILSLEEIELKNFEWTA